jgi:hypothetical protein
VNVALIPVTLLLVQFCPSAEGQNVPDITRFVRTIFYINLGLLIFNIFPIYPLDGGQILQAVLWFVVGRARSLLVASVIGLLAGVGVLFLVLGLEGLDGGGKLWLLLLAAFVLMRCWNGFQQARALARLVKMPRHDGLACPACGAAPVEGNFYPCAQCQRPFDVFAHAAVCPECGHYAEYGYCFDCQTRQPIMNWWPPVTANDKSATGNQEPPPSEV